MIEFGAIPMRVGDSIVGAGGDEELKFTIRVARSWCAEDMVIKGEAAFETACHVRIVLLPAAPFAGGRNAWKVITSRQTFEQDIRQRRGRFADGTAWMLVFFEQDYRAAQPVGNHGQQAVAKA